MSDLQGRFTLFAKDSIVFCKALPRDTVIFPLISQYIRASTSIGANYMEAQNAISRKDFRAKIFICKKEAQEALYWLNLLEESAKIQAESWNKLHSEAQEITRILQAITKKLNPIT